MSPTLLVLLLLSQAERSATSPAGTMEPPPAAPSAARWHYLTRLEVATRAQGPRIGVGWRFLGGHLYALGTRGTQLLPEGDGSLRPGAFASVGLGVDNAR